MSVSTLTSGKGAATAVRVVNLSIGVEARRFLGARSSGQSALHQADPG